jgi:hypothetical protein
MANSRILLVGVDVLLWDSLAGLLRLHGAEVLPSPPREAASVDLVVVACDCWPKRLPVRSLRAMFRRTPCLLLSGSPTSGPYTASLFARGFFAPLPMNAGRLTGIVTSLLQ